MKNHYPGACCANSLFAGLLGLSSPATQAIEPTSNNTTKLEPIIITSQKRPAYLEQVPSAVSVVSGKKINAMGIRHLEEMSAYVPNLTITQNAVFNKIFIRGVGSGLNLGFEQSVGMFMDGVYTGRGRQTGAPLLDVQRVEVIKGPQGILFGKNTTAGAISITSAQPEDYFESQVSAMYAPDQQERQFEGYVTGPLGEAFSGRIAARFSNMDGFIHNTATGNTEPDTEEQAVRAILRWQQFDNLEITSKYEFDHYARHGSTFQVTDSGGFAKLFKARDPEFEEQFNRSRSVGGSTPVFGPDFSDTTGHQAAITAKLHLQEYLLTATSGFNTYDHKELFDADLSALSALAQQRQESFYQFSQELRLSSPLASGTSLLPWTADALDYIVGAYYQYQDLDIFTNINLDLGAYARQGIPFPSVAGSRTNRSQQQTHSWALFGQTTWHLLDQLRLTAGLRYTGEQKSAAKRMRITTLATQTPNSALEPVFSAFNSNPHQFRQRRAESHVMPMFNAQWDLTAVDMLYFNFSTAYKSGGFDDNASSGRLEDYEFGEELAIGYEVGAKTLWLNGSLNINLAVFRTDFNNLQVSEFDGVSGFNVGNAASSISQGVELDARWQISDTWSLSGAAAYLDSHFDRFDNAACTTAQTAAFKASGMGGVCKQDLSGKKTRFAPEWSGNIYIEYQAPLRYFGLSQTIFADLKLLSQLNINLSDSYFLSSDLEPLLKQQGYAKLNLRIALVDRLDRWEIAFLGKNLSNKLTSNDGNDVALLNGPVARLTERPRSFAVQAKLAF